MIGAGRLEELSTLDPGDMPDDASIRVKVGDLRDLVRLVPVVRAAMHWNDDAHPGELMDELAGLRL